MKLINSDNIKDILLEWKSKLTDTYGINDEYVICIGKVIEIIEDRETEELITCKDCKWYNKSEYFNTCDKYLLVRFEHEFCSRAEKKDDKK